jgi:hypothetical protein
VDKKGVQFRCRHGHGRGRIRVDRASFLGLFFGEIDGRICRGVYDYSRLCILDDSHYVGRPRQVECRSIGNDEFADARQHARQFVSNLASTADQKD